MNFFPQEDTYTRSFSYHFRVTAALSKTLPRWEPMLQINAKQTDKNKQTSTTTFMVLTTT